MSPEKSFEFLEHTADAYVAAYGKSIFEAFENAAIALFEVMTDVKSIRANIKEHVLVEAKDEYALLYSWLENLLVRFDTSGMLFSKFRILLLDRTPDRCRLEADVWGEKFDPERHPQKVGVKAITYHRMEIVEQSDKVLLKFILDI